MARTHRRTRPLAATTLVAVLLLAGCSDASEPPAGSGSSPEQSTSSPAPTKSPSSSPSPTLTEPQPGKNFKRTDEKGAVAAAKYFVELHTYMLQSGDPDAWKQLMWKDCNFCLNALDTMKKFQREGSVFEGGETGIKVTKIYEEDTLLGVHALDAQLTEQATVIKDRNGEHVRTESAGGLDARFELLHDGTTWRLVNVLDKSVL